jgi:hypothetical protein
VDEVARGYSIENREKSQLSRVQKRLLVSYPCSYLPVEKILLGQFLHCRSNCSISSYWKFSKLWYANSRKHSIPRFSRTTCHHHLCEGHPSVPLPHEARAVTVYQLIHWYQLTRNLASRTSRFFRQCVTPIFAKFVINRRTSFYNLFLSYN